MSYDVLCQELVVEILSRLPAKSLLRFRSVSKSLYAAISSPEFIRLHTLRSPKKVMITHICYKSTPVKHICTLHSEDQMSSNNPYTGIQAVRISFTYYKIFGSCNGILCVREYLEGKIHLWNPSIRRKVTVHDHPLKHSSFYIACDVMLGFGFDPIIDDYKILMMHKPHAFVYTLKTHTWHEVAPPYATSSWVVNHSQCLFNGALHCLVNTDPILTFHLSSEVFSTIELPEPSWITFDQVTTIKGSLAVISSDRNDHSWIWVRNTAAASWSVAYKFNTNPFKGTHVVLQIAPSEEFLCCRYDDGILVYNPETQSRRVYSNDRFVTTIDMVMFEESLELFDMGTLCM